MVRFVPPVAQAELADWYAAATLVCVPSYNESFGLVAVEAQAAGTPVVAAAVGGLTTVVRDGISGLLVEGHDPEDYARAMERIVAAPDLRERMSAGARAHAAEFAWERTADATLEVYRQAERAMRLDARGAARDLSRRGARDAARPTWTPPTWSGAGSATASSTSTCPARRSCRPPAASTSGSTRSGVHAFVARNPDENHERVYRWLLEKNLRLFGVAFAVDRTGDIYLDGRLPLSAVTPDELDRLLGAVLTYADESFNTILELGFASSIRKEWEWRTSRGESTKNLEAFRGWLEQPAD